MKKIFDEYGSAVIVLLVVGGILGIVAGMIAIGGGMGVFISYFENSICGS